MMSRHFMALLLVPGETARGVPPPAGIRRRKSRSTCGSCVRGAQILLAALLAACGSPPARSGRAVAVWMTTPDLQRHLTRLADVTAAGDDAPAISFDDATPLQPIDGFGAAFTDSSTSLLWNALDTPARDQVMTGLFSRSDGIGLSFMRVPMAASDFTACSCSYSYDDGSGDDPTLAAFTTAHDDDTIIPVIRQAQAINPQMKLLANPWSPPAWMKTNGSMLGTAGGQAGTLRDDAAGALAQYFVRFLRDYRQKGVNVWAITPQNEPSYAPDTYPGMLFSADAEAAFVSNQLAPALAAGGVGDVQILGGDDIGADQTFAEAFWSSPAGDAIGGTAWHCYAGLGEMSAIHDERPDKPLYMTECSTGPTGIAGDTTLEVLDALRNWASGALLWNLALDPDGQPKQGAGCIGCTGLVTVDPAARAFSYTINAYELAQFSKFVAPGAHCLATSDGGGSSGIVAQAFANPNGGEVLVAYNGNTISTAFTVAWRGGKTFRFTLDAGGTVTFVDTGP
jgi:glucosylceramidase